TQPVGVAETDPAPTPENMDLGSPKTGDAGLAEAQVSDPLHAYVNALGGMLGTQLPAPGQWDPALLEASSQPASGQGSPESGTEPTTSTVKEDNASNSSATGTNTP